MLIDGLHQTGAGTLAFGVIVRLIPVPHIWCCKIKKRDILFEDYDSYDAESHHFTEKATKKTPLLAKS